MNCDSCEEPKKLWITAEIVREFTRSVGVIVLLVLERHALADDARHARQTDVELVGQQLAHRAHAPVAEMVDVVGDRRSRRRDR